MKVTLEFDDQDEAITALNAVYWKQIVRDLDEYLRLRIKHSDEDETVRQEIRDRLHELISDYNLILE
jgi:hypothetical protein